MFETMNNFRVKLMLKNYKKNIIRYLIDAINDRSRAENHWNFVHQLHVVPQSHVEQPRAHADR